MVDRAKDLGQVNRRSECMRLSWRSEPGYVRCLAACFTKIHETEGKMQRSTGIAQRMFNYTTI